MRAVLEKMDAHVRVLSSGVGGISLGIGVVLSLSPRGSAEFLGWGDREREARILGVADLVVGAGLLLAPRRSRPMLARAVLNAVIASIYVRASLDTETRRKRTVGGVCLMAALTVNDYYLSRRLAAVEAPYNLARRG